MYQPTLRACLGHSDESITRPEDGPLEVYDLFCCAGGFTTGSKNAGCKVVYACDAWPAALETYQRNHPETHIECLTLPATIPFPTDGRPFHVHGSPPCQRFSLVGMRYNTEANFANATNLLEWFLETAVTCGATSWSMEQVSHAGTRAIVEAARQRHPGRVSYATINFYDLGVPQHRKRLIAGSPALVARLVRQACAARRRCVSDVISNPKSSTIRNNKGWTSQRLRLNRKPGQSKYEYTRTTDEDCTLLPLTGPAPTVVCNGDTRWWWRDANGKAKSIKLSVHEAALLQTFPKDYSWPSDVMLARELVGNAVPPLVAELLLRADELPLSQRRAVGAIICVGSMCNYKRSN